MHFQNAYIFQNRAGFVRGNLYAEDGYISKLQFHDETAAPDFAQNSCPAMDPDGTFIIPGLVDIHIHGAAGFDFSDGDPESLHKMSKHCARRGITSFMPTSVSLPYAQLAQAFDTAARFMKRGSASAARVIGINMEGPYFAPNRKGSQNIAYLRGPDAAEFKQLQEAIGNRIRIVSVAPELSGAIEFIQEVSESKVCRTAIAHTDATYEQTMAAFAAGASHVTHLFNAMPGIHHRAPGVIGAACECENVTAELISDGCHIHPSVVRMAFKLFPGRICLISDALRCCGMPDGEYEFGGQKIYKSGGVAQLSDGTIAGAASDLFDDMVNAIRYGVPFVEAVTAATLTPATVAGAHHEIGSIEVGKRADLVILDGRWNIREIYIGGRKVVR